MIWFSLIIQTYLGLQQFLFWSKISGGRSIWTTKQKTRKPKCLFRSFIEHKSRSLPLWSEGWLTSPVRWGWSHAPPSSCTCSSSSCPRPPTFRSESACAASIGLSRRAGRVEFSSYSYWDMWTTRYENCLKWLLYEPLNRTDTVLRGITEF